MDLSERIRSIPDFPKKGIVFKDITTLLADSEAFALSVDQMKALFDQYKPDVVIGIESRGFIFAGVLAHAWKVGMVPVRKPGKLPYKTVSETYSLEYGEDSLEIHIDALKAGQRVLIVDDLLATGGTARATANLVEKLNAEVIGFCFLIELEFLKGRELISDYRIESLIQVPM